METKQQFLEEINKVKGSKRDYLNKLFQYVSEAVIRAAVHKNVKKDEFIIRAGEPCDTVYIILKGDVAGADVFSVDFSSSSPLPFQVLRM